MKNIFIVLSLVLSSIILNAQNNIWIKESTIPNSSVTGFYFINDTGFCINNAGNILLTNNSGNSFQVQNENLDMIAIHFVTPKIGYAVGQSGKIKKTTDGGLNWQNQNSNTGTFLDKVYFADSLKGIAYHSSIVRTIDGGLTWERSNSSSGSTVTAIKFIDCLVLK